VLDLGDGHTIRKAAATRGRDVPILLTP
jgi:hypothetical protein